jgi:uncharacterized protein YeaO (DUF488 family)
MLIARFRPRYMKKENENWDALYRELAPSRQSRCYDYFHIKYIGINIGNNLSER